MEILTQFPIEGWCIDADENLGKFLSEKYDDFYKDPGQNGFAWNSHGFWKIDTNSSKQNYCLQDLKYFFAEGYSNAEILEIANERYPPGTHHKGASGYGHKHEFFVKGPLYWKNEIIFSEGQQGAIYVKGYEEPWAKIIPTPEEFPKETLKQQLDRTNKMNQERASKILAEMKIRTKRKKKESFVKKDRWMNKADNIVKLYNPKPNMILTKRLKKTKNRI